VIGGDFVVTTDAQGNAKSLSVAQQDVINVDRQPVVTEATAKKATGLPPGLSISAAGVVSGTPTTRGSYTATVTGTDSGGASGSATFGYTIW
jgi:hypothetical protein